MSKKYLKWLLNMSKLAAERGSEDFLRERFKKLVVEVQNYIEDSTAEWVGVSPQVDSEKCSKCGYDIQSEELRTPHCPWCGREMINFEVSNDE